jgi:hypothetical protein
MANVQEFKVTLSPQSLKEWEDRHGYEPEGGVVTFYLSHFIGGSIPPEVAWVTWDFGRVYSIETHRRVIFGTAILGFSKEPPAE